MPYFHVTYERRVVERAHETIEADSLDHAKELLFAHPDDDLGWMEWHTDETADDRLHIVIEEDA